MAVQSGFVLMVTGEGLGRGDEDLGRHLMSRFLHEIGGQRALPEKVIFANTGARLVTEESPVLEQIRRIEDEGVQIVACGTCLERLGLLDRVAVGGRTDMSTTVTSLAQASKVISV